MIHKNNASVVAMLINMFGLKVGIEVGVSKGITAEIVLKNCPSLKEYYMVDPDPHGVFNYTLLSLYNSGKFIKLLSKQAVKAFDDSTFDFIYLDADHGYESVKEDIQMWYPKLKWRGVIAGHDYHTSTDGVIKAVNEAFPKVNLETEENGNQNWWLVKENK